MFSTLLRMSIVLHAVTMHVRMLYYRRVMHRIMAVLLMQAFCDYDV